MPATTSATCTRCDGSGQYHGARRDGTRYNAPCFGCSPGYRSRARYGYRIPTPLALPEATLPNVVSPVFGLARGDAALLAFRAAHPAEMDWLVAQQLQGGNAFAMSLLGAIKRYGNLTPRQLAAVQRNLPVAVIAPAESVPNAVQQATIDSVLRANEATSARQFQTVRTIDGGTRLRVVASPVVTINADPLRRALDAAAASGLRKVRLDLGAVTFKRTGPTYRNGGEGLILCYYEGRYYGTINRDNTISRAFNSVDPAIIAAFTLAASDPRAAAQAHGNDTGNCACCRRTLTDPVSVMTGIGPRCLSRFSWS